MLTCVRKVVSSFWLLADNSFSSLAIVFSASVYAAWSSALPSFTAFSLSFSCSALYLSTAFCTSSLALAFALATLAFSFSSFWVSFSISWFFASSSAVLISDSDCSASSSAMRFLRFSISPPVPASSSSFLAFRAAISPLSSVTVISVTSSDSITSFAISSGADSKANTLEMLKFVHVYEFEKILFSSVTRLANCIILFAFDCEKSRLSSHHEPNSPCGNRSFTISKRRPADAAIMSATLPTASICWYNPFASWQSCSVLLPSSSLLASLTS